MEAHGGSNSDVSCSISSVAVRMPALQNLHENILGVVCLKKQRQDLMKPRAKKKEFRTETYVEFLCEN